MGYKKRSGSPSGEIAVLAERQHGIVSRAQLRALGLSDRVITGRVAAGALYPVFRGTFAVGHRATGGSARMMAAVLASGNGTVVSHGSAAELLGLWDKRPVAIEVIAPRGAGRKIAGVRRHDVPRPEPGEIETRLRIPCTTASRTLVDMAGRLGERSLRRMVEQAAVLRVLDVREVERILAQRRRRGAPLLRAILAPWRTGDGRLPRLRSPLEARFLPVLLEAGLPRPRCNVVPRVDGKPVELDGKPIEVDFLWEAKRLIVETDGEQTHGTSAGFRRDRRRDQVLMDAGYRVPRVTWDQLEDEPDAVVALVRRMLDAG